MNYEEFYQQAQAVEKGIKDKLTGAQKYSKSIAKNTEKGDLKSLYKDLAQMQSLLDEYRGLIDKMQELADGFDTKEYIESGDFAQQMIDYCKQYSVDVKGDFPTYEMFPYKVKIDAENQDLYVDRKKVQCLRPQSFVKDIRQSREKYLKASFNAGAFLNELASAYDQAVINKEHATNTEITEPDLLLRDLYEYMTPMQKARREYDLQNYAFDLARLYASEIEITKDGRKFEFGTSKKTNKLIRILDQNGEEQFLGTIRFLGTKQ